MINSFKSFLEIDKATSDIALMMSSAHCSSHIVLICTVVSYGLTLRKAV